MVARADAQQDTCGGQLDCLALVLGIAQGFGYLQNDVHLFPILVALGFLLLVAGVATTKVARLAYRWLFAKTEWRQFTTTGVLMTLTMSAVAFVFAFLQLVEFHRVHMAQLRNEPAPPAETIPQLPPPPPQLVTVALENPLVVEASWARVGLELENELLRRQLALLRGQPLGAATSPQQDPPTPPDRFGPATETLRERLARLPPIVGCEAIGRDGGPLDGALQGLHNQTQTLRAAGEALLVRLRASPGRDDVESTREVVQTWVNRVRNAIDNSLGQVAEYDFRRSATSPSLWNELTDAERKALTVAEAVYKEATGTVICLDVLLTNLKGRG